MAATQMNIRIDEDVKKAGDAALASVNYSPSLMVQTVWDYAARNRHNKKALQRLVQVVEDSEGKSPQAEKTRKLKQLHSGLEMRKLLLEQMGIEGVPRPCDLTDEDLLYQAHLDKMAERGVSL